MRTKQKIIWGMVVILVLFNLVVFMTAFVSKRKSLETRLVQDQNQEAELLEQKKKVAERKEMNDIKKGLSKMTLGKIESVDLSDKSFVINVNPFGKWKKYTIQTSPSTKYLLQTIGDGDGNNGLDEPEPERSFSEADPSALKEGFNAEVHFSKRLDLDREEELMAEEIIVIPIKK